MEDIYQNTLLMKRCIKEHMKVENEKQQEVLLKLLTYMLLN